MSRPTLEIKDLRVSIEGREILKGLHSHGQRRRSARSYGPERLGQEHVGQHADGPSALQRRRREVLIDGEDILEMEPDERARKGLFLAFQYPVEIPGVTVANFLRSAYNAVHGDNGEHLSVLEFHQHAARANEGTGDGRRVRRSLLE